MPQPNWIVTVGMAKEGAGTWGTAVTPPTIWLSSSAPVFTEKQVAVFDKGLRGIRSATQAMTFGAAHTEIDIPGMPWYGDDSGNLLMSMMGADALTGTAKNGTITALAPGGTTATYTVGAGGASATGDVFKIDAGLPTQEIIIPTSVAANVWTIPATGVGSAKFNHAGGATAVSLFTHTISMLNTGQPPSYTVAKYDALNTTNARQIAGVYFEQVDIKFASSAGLTIDAKGRGKLGTNVAKATATYSTEPFNVPWQSAFTIAGVANARVVDFTISIKAANDQIFGMNATQSPTAAISDQLTVTGTFTIVPDDYTEFTYYLQNTQPVVSILLDNGSTQTIFQMSKCALIDPVTFAHSGNYSTLTATYEAISNSTDAGATGNAPFKAILRNGKSAAY